MTQLMFAIASNPHPHIREIQPAARAVDRRHHRQGARQGLERTLPDGCRVRGSHPPGAAKAGPGVDVISEPKAKREPLHAGTIEIVGYKREDGLYDIEGGLLDRKDVAFRGRAQAGARGGGARHVVRITVDRELRIVDAAAASDSMPYIGNARPDRAGTTRSSSAFHRPRLPSPREGAPRRRPRLHAHHGAGGLARHGRVPDLRRAGLAPPDRKPPQLDRCHALDSHSPTVARFYPKWYRGTSPAADAGPSENH